MRVNGFSRPDRQSAQPRQGQPVRSKYRMAFIAARMSVLRGRSPGDASGISGSSRAPPTPHPSDHSDSRRPPADKSDGVPPSTSLFAITVSAITVNHAIRRRATGFWVRRYLSSQSAAKS